MALTTGWVAGRLQSTYAAAFTTGDITTSNSSGPLATGQVIMSSTIIDNTTALDQFAHIAAQLTIGSSTIAAGANLAFWIAALLPDGTTYGDGRLTAGTAAAAGLAPLWAPCCTIPLYAAAAQTLVQGSSESLGVPFLIPSAKFRYVMQQNSGFTLTTGSSVVDHKTVDFNLNA